MIKKSPIGLILAIILLVYLGIYMMLHKNTKPPQMAVKDLILPIVNQTSAAVNISQESKLAHQLLDGLRGIEIGASYHNPFGLDTLNIDYSEDPNARFQKKQLGITGHRAKVHILARGDQLPFTNNSMDFVVNAHVLEHFYDPIRAIQEWLRVVRPGGYVYMDIPHKERTFDAPKNRTTLAELLERHGKNGTAVEHLADHGHQSVWITEDLLELCHYFNWTVAEWRDVDDKVGNGFTIVLRKPTL